MADKKAPPHYIEKCRKMGEEMGKRDGSNTVIFTDHAVDRCYSRRIDPWKALMVVDNPGRRLEDNEVNDKIYERYIKIIGQREVYVSLIREPKIIDDKEVEVIILTSVAWRARVKKSKKGKP